MAEADSTLGETNCCAEKDGNTPNGNFLTVTDCGGRDCS
jgi:hypothetical protein